MLNRIKIMTIVLVPRFGRVGLFFVLSTLLILAACRTNLVHKPTWRLHGVEIGQVDAMEATLHVNVKITNPNRVAMVVERVAYRLIFNETTLARGEKVGAFEFRPYQEAGMSLPVSVDLTTLLAQLPFLQRYEAVAYRVEGEVTLKAFGIRKTFPFKEPEAPPAGEASETRPGPAAAPAQQEQGEKEGHQKRP